jgi:hypothetical protein
VHITALCPFCRSAYQVEAALRGQLVRCPNASCRKIFPVPAEKPGTDAPAPPKPPSNGPRSGSVGDLVPILPAEQAAPSPEQAKPADGDWWQSPPPMGTQAGPGNERQAPPARPPAAPAAGTPASDAAWWRDAPPVRHPQKAAKTGETPVLPASPTPAQRRRSPARPTAETQPIPAPEPEKANQPRELPPGMWEPPPVRRGQSDPEQATQLVEETAATTTQTEPEDEGGPRLSKRRAWFVIAAIAGLFLAVSGIAVTWAWQKLYLNEVDLATQADKEYTDGLYDPAQKDFRELAEKFPSSEDNPKYSFMVEWCGVCKDVSSPDDDLLAVADRFDRLVKEHKSDTLLKDLGHDVGQRLVQLAKTLADRTANPPDEQPLETVKRIEQLRRSVADLGSGALTKEDTAKIQDHLANVRKAVERASKRRNVLAQLKMRDKESPMDAIRRARSLAARMERELPGIQAEAEPALAQLEEAHLASVVYHPAKDAPPPPPASPVDEGDTLLFAPLLSPAWIGNAAPANDAIVLALSRGICYALKKNTGESKWATRVGIDTTALPVRVPLSAFTPELLLVLSADTQTLTALNVEGGIQWEYPVGQPVLGRPIIIDQRAYLADYSGLVHEIELSRGQLIGRWDLGQPLTCGGAREIDANGETSRLYFPADDSCIYVLDVKSHRCVTILYDGHPSGSLRSEPVIVPPEGDTVPGYLILNQASGLDEMELRVFELPLQDRHAAPLTLHPPARLPGWTWFEPKEDGEKLAILSDAGFLGLFGIRQLGNGDPPLFPWLQAGGLDLSPFLQRSGERKRPSFFVPRSERGRAQVVHMQGDDLWVLAHGRFQQVRLGMNWKTGPQAVPVWNEPPVLGSPLHQTQIIADRNGLSTFFLVTQAFQKQICLATAVDEQGQILWQRQLGLVCQGEPLMLAPPGGGPPLLLALDQGGGLFVLDPLQPNRPRFLRDASALAENPLVPPRLLPAADGHSAYEVAAPGDSQELIVRHIQWADGARELRVQESKAALPMSPRKEVLAPACSPVVIGSQLLIAMTDGTIRRLSLTEDKPSLRTGPDWREPRVPVLAPCHLLALGGDRFLTTDGNRRLSVYEWPADENKIWQSLPKGGEALKPLASPVAAPPVLLPSADGQPRVVVADSAGVLHLFAVMPDGSLQAGLTWELRGNLSAGPFIQAAPEGGWRIGCVLDRRRLLWIDPAKEQPLWTYDSRGPAILGQPQQIEDMLVAALQSGLYVAIDPKTGQLRGSGYTLRTSAAPAATPMTFGPGRMFAPLSDGTALVLSVELLKKN